MKYFVTTVSNGTFEMKSEWTDKEKAIVAFHQKCASLHNTADVKKGVVKILDDQLDVVDGKMEVIVHEATE